MLLFSAPQTALPYSKGSPPLLLKRLVRLTVYDTVASNLTPPERSICFWKTKKWAVMAVPETTVHKNDGTMLWQDKIWPAGERCCMESISVSKREECLSHHKLNPCILGSNRGHDPTSDFRRHNVSHSMSPRKPAAKPRPASYSRLSEQLP